MKYRGHTDYQHPDEALEVEADSRRHAAEKIAELLDREFVKDDEGLPERRTIIVWPVEKDEPVMSLYDRRREFEVSPRVTYHAKATDGGDLI